MKVHTEASPTEPQMPMGDASAVPPVDPQENEVPQDGGMEQSMGDTPSGEDVESNGKNDIQQAAGELSQMIRDYNAEQQEPDVETNKFAAGMVVAAAIKDLDEKDRKDILKKLKAGEFDENDESTDVPEEENIQAPAEEEMPMEGKTYTKKQIKEATERKDVVDIFEDNGWIYYEFFDRNMDGDKYTCFVMDDKNATCDIDSLERQIRQSYDKVKIGTRSNRYAPEQPKKYIVAVVENNLDIE